MQLAARVRRHTGILRGVAHRLSSTRDDAPATGAEAWACLDAYLEQQRALAGRRGLGAATAKFVDGLIARAKRWGRHLFECFDDKRIPATTNELEGDFGTSKRMLRHALGSASTQNSVVSNLGADVLVAYHQVHRTGETEELLNSASAAAAFEQARSRLRTTEAGATRSRSLVRNFDAHVSRLSKRSPATARLPD